MNPYSFDVDPARELRLRKHVREVLLPYARTHLTSDHVAFTEKVVEELLLQTLESVPMADAASFFLPTEPFQVLMRSLDSLDLTPPEERWVTPAGHIEYLRAFFPPPLDLQDLRTVKCWHENNDHSHYMKLSLMYRPVSSPILSKRARRETPKLCSKKYRASIPRTTSTLTTFLALNTLPVPSIEELPTPSVDDVLDLRLELRVTDARPFLQSVLIPSVKKKPADCFEDTPNVPEFLHRESPPRCLPRLDSPPLFSRVAQKCSSHGGFRGNTKNGVSNPTRVSDLVSMLQVASPELIDGEDGDINGYHMEVVNGCATLIFSSPSPPSLHASDGSDFNDLRDISPGTPATSLVASKMDEVEIPRIRKFGHKNTSSDRSTNHSGTADMQTVAKSPGFFITSFISAPIPMVQAHESITFQLEDIKSGMHSPHRLSPGQNATDSLLGQPPSAAEGQAAEKKAGPADSIEDFEEQEFDDAVASIYVSTPKDPLSFIREEKLDDQDIMLMDVPNLASPTIHSREPILFPEGMQTFVAPKGELSRPDSVSHGSNGLGPMTFLRPVKGIKPLTLDLSWRPFNFGKTIPTDEDVAGISKSIQLEDEIPGYRDEMYQKTTQVLLGLGAPLPPAEELQPALNPIVPRGCKEFGTSPIPKRVEESGHLGYLLTQRERLRESGSTLILEAEIEVQDDLDAEQDVTPWIHIDGRGEILVQDENSRQHEQNQGSQYDLMEYHSRKPDYPFDDSGIDIVDDVVTQISTNEFAGPHLHLHPPQDDILFSVHTLEANKENVDDQSENKENVPPRGTGDYQPSDSQPDPLMKQFDWSSYLEFPESETPSFEPLSFASQSQLTRPSGDVANSMVQDTPPPTPSSLPLKRSEDNLISPGEHEQTNSRATKRRKLDDLVPASSKDLFDTFIKLRNRATSNRSMEHSETQHIQSPHQISKVPEQIFPQTVPDDVFDRHTARLPEHWIPAAEVHRYLVSVTFIQKRALVHELQGRQCRVVLVERHDLGGTDIIIDPNYGVLFIPLLALPATIESAVERISGESWRYSRLLVVFEAFPSSRSYRADRSQPSRPVPYAYTPPVCKAIKKFRRNLGIAEGCGTMNPGCTVTWAFANDVEEAVKFVRCFGEEACAISMEGGRGILWGTREWLEEEEREGESDLAQVHGMNAFAAFVMLYNRSLETILELSPEVRLEEFGPLLGEERMMGLNAVIESRFQQMAADLADSVVGPRC